MPDLVTHHNPKDKIEIPAQSLFESHGSEYITSPTAQAVVEALIHQLPDHYLHLRDKLFVCLWRLEGGKKGGRPTLGAVQLASPLEKLGTEVDVWLWLAADHLRGANHFQLEALCFHLLQHLVEKGEDGGLGIVQPTIRAFVPELTRYGAWTTTLAAANKAMQTQLSLGLFDEFDDLMRKMDDAIRVQTDAPAAPSEGPMDQYNRERDEAGEDEQ